MQPPPASSDRSNRYSPVPAAPSPSPSPSPSLSPPPASAPLVPSLNWALLLQIAAINIGSHYNQHSLSSLSTQIIDLLDANRTQYGLLFTSQEIPGILIALLSGLILVYVPHAPAAVFLTTAVSISSAMCAIAVDRRSYYLLMAGRFLFGLTQGALTTVQGAIIAARFHSHVGTGFGIMLFTSRLSSFAGLSLPAFFAAKFGILTSMWITFFVTVPPILSTVLFATIHSSYRDPSQPQSDVLSPLQLARSFPKPFWLVSYLWIVVAGVVYSLEHFAPDALSTTFEIDPTIAGLLSGSLVLIAAFASPPLGMIQDRLHHRSRVLALCCIALVVGVVLLVVVVQLPKPIGLWHAVFASVALLFFACGFSAGPVTLMACVALVVHQTVMPAALGIYKAGESAALALLHGLVGALRDWSGSYFLPLLLLAFLAVSGVPVAVALGTRLETMDPHEPAGEKRPESYRSAAEPL